MSRVKYIYNPKTLRYEPARFSIPAALMTLVGLLAFGFLFFVALVGIQNYLVDSDTELALREENKALVHYQSELASELTLADRKLEDLEAKDNSLYEKIFEAKKTDVKSPVEKQADKSVLLADGSAFKEINEALVSRSSELMQTAFLRNHYFSNKAEVEKSDLSWLTSVPSYPPLADFNAEKIVSGYGMRINPFHKGNYHHDGIDMAAPRGTDVLAAAKGTVINVSKSDLQAGFGTYITIDHGNGYVTQYANLGTAIVSYGQRVTKGQPIGTIGISGGSVAPHVHYEVLKDGKNVDPVKFFIHGLSAGMYEAIWQASKKQNQSLD